jgi:hypothetical protein
MSLKILPMIQGNQDSEGPGAPQVPVEDLQNSIKDVSWR